MNWYATALYPESQQPLGMRLVDGHLELLDSDFRTAFQIQAGRVAAKSGGVDPSLYRGGLAMYGCGVALGLALERPVPFAGILQADTVLRLAVEGTRVFPGLDTLRDSLAECSVAPEHVADPHVCLESTRAFLDVCAAMGLPVECVLEEEDSTVHLKVLQPGA